MAPVKDGEPDAFLLSKHPGNSVLELFTDSCRTRRLHRRPRGVEEGLNRGGERTLDICDLSFPIGFPGRYHDLQNFKISVGSCRVVWFVTRVSYLADVGLHAPEHLGLHIHVEFPVFMTCIHPHEKRYQDG